MVCLNADIDEMSSQNLQILASHVFDAKTKIEHILNWKNSSYIELMTWYVNWIGISIFLHMRATDYMNDVQSIQLLQYLSIVGVVASTGWFIFRIIYKIALKTLPLHPGIIKAFDLMGKRIHHQQTYLLDAYFEHALWIQNMLKQIDTYNPHIPPGVGKDIGELIETYYKNTLKTHTVPYNK